MVEDKNQDNVEKQTDSDKVRVKYEEVKNLDLSDLDINRKLKEISDTAYKSASGNKIIQLPRERLNIKEIAERGDVKQSHIQKIKESIEINGELANIKELKNSEGNIILECKGTTPYIHTDALEDIIGLSQEFFENTGTPLTLNNAFRSMAYQNKLKSIKGDKAAKSGKSGHNLGVSVDMDRTDRNNLKIGGLNGMKKLAKKHGFVSNILGEDRHFDHTSLPKKEDIRYAKAKELDEYLAMANKNIEKARKYNT